MSEPVSNQFLETRVKTLHNRVTATGLQAKGLPVTAEALGRGLKDGTVSVVETTINGKPVRIVTTDKPALYRLLQQHRNTLLLPGEILGSAPVYVSPPLKEGRNPRGYYSHPKTPRRHQYIHAEQLGANDARRMGGKSGRIATSNAGCTDLCMSLIGDEFPEFQHVNPQTRKPDPSVGTGQTARKSRKPSPQAPSPAPPAPASAKPTGPERGTTNNSLTKAPPPPKPTGGVPGPSASKFTSSAAAAADLGRGGFKARSLVIGVKAWRAARLVSKVLITCFVPLKVIDVVIEIGMALWDRKREREERVRREKQRTLEAVFKQGRDKIEKGVAAIVNNPQVMQAFIDDWDRNKTSGGFQYVRIHATLTVETHRYGYSRSDEVIEDMTNYRLLSVDVYPTNWAHEFKMEPKGEEREVDTTEEERTALISKGRLAMTRKTARNRALSYTIVPPVMTPFDVIVTKINNLFVDIAAFIDWISNSGALHEFEGFNFTYAWNDQFNVALQYPSPLNQAVCEYCLGYLYSASKRLSRHPLEEQDLEGNLEDPRKGWKRRFSLLNSCIVPREAPYGKNFTELARHIKRLAKSEDPEIAAAIDELYSGARSIWYDLERIEHNISKPEYYYLGPEYKLRD